MTNQAQTDQMLLKAIRELTELNKEAIASNRELKDAFTGFKEEFGERLTVLETDKKWRSGIYKTALAIAGLVIGAYLNSIFSHPIIIHSH